MIRKLVLLLRGSAISLALMAPLPHCIGLSVSFFLTTKINFCFSSDQVSRSLSRSITPTRVAPTLSTFRTSWMKAMLEA
ncbi:UNVERIFIED_CONTAM: hypothetical protein GTU68_029472 [Idotea baltica]|nr:hypothetical protein [Idotea baltica]